MAAWFGPEAEAPFDEVRQAVHEVLVAAAEMLVGNVHQPRQESDREFWREQEAKIWKVADGDAIDSRVLAAVGTMERFCRPVLSSAP